MKKTVVMLAVIVLAAIAGCSNPAGGNIGNGFSGGGGGGTGGGSTVTGTYTNTDTDGNAYNLVRTGGNYTLTVTLRATGQVKQSTGTVQVSGPSSSLIPVNAVSGNVFSFTLIPANAAPGNVFSVMANSASGVITSLTAGAGINYDDGDSVAGPAQLSADKTALKTAIAAANAAKAGVFVEEVSDANVPAGASWVPSSSLTTLNLAIAGAETLEANPDATEAEVNDPAIGAVTELRNKITSFNGVKGTGTKADAPAVNRTALAAAITAAKAAKAGVVEAADGDSLARGTVWVSDMTTFNTAIEDAEEDAADVSKNQGDVDTAVSTLNAAIITFNAAKRTVNFPDKAALGAAIIAANAALSGVGDSVDGGNLIPGATWVLHPEMSDFTGVISAARGTDGTPGASQGTVDAAVSALNAAKNTFNAAKRTVPATVLSLTNIPAQVSGPVAVLIAKDDVNTAIGYGTVSAASVTVAMTNWLSGAPWINPAPSDSCIVCFTKDMTALYYSDPPIVPGTGDIDVSGFTYDGPSGGSVGNITGTITLNNIPAGVSMPGGLPSILLRAFQYSYDNNWASWSIPLNYTGGAMLTQPFDIPLYTDDNRGTLSSSKDVYFSIQLRFPDNTSIDIDAPTQGKTVTNHNATTPVGAITFNIPSVSLITGTVKGITLPPGKTLKRASLSYYHKMTEGPLPYVEFSEVPIVGGACTIRVTGEGQFNVTAQDTEGNEYYKNDILTWNGGSTFSIPPVTLP